jgi:hypothetical protein
VHRASATGRGPGGAKPSPLRLASLWVFAPIEILSQAGVSSGTAAQHLQGPTDGSTGGSGWARRRARERQSEVGS